MHKVLEQGALFGCVYQGLAEQDEIPMKGPAVGVHIIRWLVTSPDQLIRRTFDGPHFSLGDSVVLQNKNGKREEFAQSKIEFIAFLWTTGMSMIPSFGKKKEKENTHVKRLEESHGMSDRDDESGLREFVAIEGQHVGILDVMRILVSVPLRPVPAAVRRGQSVHETHLTGRSVAEEDEFPRRHAGIGMPSQPLVQGRRPALGESRHGKVKETLRIADDAVLAPYDGLDGWDLPERTGSRRRLRNGSAEILVLFFFLPYTVQERLFTDSVCCR